MEGSWSRRGPTKRSVPVRGKTRKKFLMPDFDITCGRCSAPLTHECGGEDLITAIKRLYKFVPEDGTPEAVIAEGKKNGMWNEEDEDEEALRFFSETFLYALLGKEDARTVLALINNVVRACGIEAWKVEHQAARELAREVAVKKYETRRQEAFRLRAQRNNKRMCACGHAYGVHHSTEANLKIRICTKCKTKCVGYVHASNADQLEKGLPEADRAALQALQTALVELQKDDEKRAERKKHDRVYEVPPEQQLAERIQEILQEKL